MNNTNVKVCPKMYYIRIKLPKEHSHKHITSIVDTLRNVFNYTYEDAWLVIDTLLEYYGCYLPNKYTHEVVETKLQKAIDNDLLSASMFVHQVIH
jgi:hypothetical protein